MYNATVYIGYVTVLKYLQLEDYIIHNMLLDIN